MRTELRRSLLGKYLLLLATLVGGLVLLSGAVGAYFAYVEALAAVAAIQRGQARYGAAEVAAVMHGLRDALHAAAAKFDAESGAAVDALRFESAWLLRHHAAITDLRWFDPDGRERLVYGRYGVTAAGGDGHDAVRLQALERGEGIGPLHFRKSSEPYVTVARAARPGGTVLQAEVNLKPLSVLLARTSAAGVAYVVDEDGYLLAHPDLSLVLAKSRLDHLPQVRRALAAGTAASSGDGHDLARTEVIASSAPIEGLPWRVVVEQPRREALASVYATVARAFGLLALGVLAAVAASAWLARRLVQPIRAIEAGAARIAEGSFDEPIVLPTGDELEQLAERVNAMARRLKETHETQERRIAERTEALAQAIESKTRFLAAAAHDLRQPIHALGLFADQLQAQPLRGEAAALASSVARSTRALDELVETLLDLSRLDVGGVQPAPQVFALQRLFDRLALQFEPSARARGLGWRVRATPLWVRSDPQLLERIAANLVANALRYTERGGVLLAARRRGDDVELRVVDTGVGIAPEHQARIFDDFYRVPAVGRQRRDEPQGLGMGLAIVKRLVQLLGHALSLRSVPGRGTAIGLRMPVAEAQPETAGPAAAPAAAVSLVGRRVLLIDDEESARRALAGTLARWGCHVDSAANGDEAVALARRRRPDAVLCDLTLTGGESGLDVVQRLTASSGGDLACAYLTGGAEPATMSRARASGRLLVMKPLAPARLRALLENLLA